MQQPVRVPAWRAEYEVSARKHWLVDASEALASSSVSTIGREFKGSPGVTTYFVSVDNEGKIADVMKTLRSQVRLIGAPVKSNPTGTLARLVSKKSDRLVRTLANIPGRVSLSASPDKHVIHIIVELPAGAEASTPRIWERIGRRINALPDIELLSKPKVERVMLSTDEFVDLRDAKVLDLSLDEDERKIALELFRTHYYDPEVKDKAKLEDIAKNVGISKPTLIKRKKRLEALGISSMLGPSIGEETLQLATESLKHFVKKKETLQVT